MSERVLYVSDLDGTLLRGDKTISPFSLSAINALIEKGMLFTYATARSFYTASEVSRGLCPKIPIILYNGTFMATPSGEVIYTCSFEKKTAERALALVQEAGISPLVYSFFDGKEHFSYDEKCVTRGIRAFLDDHPSDSRCNPTKKEMLTQGELFHITCIDEREALLPLYERFRAEYSCVLYKDAYTGEWWLEIMPQGATKANAIKELAKMLDCDKIVCFGDGENDLSMLEVAHELYAVENASEALKAGASGIIDSNENDGVARFLLKRGIYGQD